MIGFDSIFSNGALGIDLAPRGPTPNDPDDSDAGPNDLQNFPVLTKAEVGEGKTTFEGTLQSRPNVGYRIELYESPDCDPSGFGEGRRRVTGASVTTDASGSASFNLTVSSELAAGTQITATATVGPTASRPDSSSEFSRCIPVRSRPPDCSTVQAAPDELRVRHGELVLVTLSGATDPDGDPVELTISGVTQDEPVRSPGDHTAPDAAAAGPGQVRLRAERDVRGDGRVYRVSFVGSDGRGGECTGTVKVAVRRKRSVPAIDSAPPSFDSFGG